MENNQEQQTENNQEQKTFLLIDAYNLIYRAFHGNQNKLTSPSGMPTNAIYTVSTMLLKIIKQHGKSTYMLAVFDGGGDNFRKEIDENYKANRKEMPEDLKVQFPYIKQIFKILGFPIYQAHDVEADDVIASLAVRASAVNILVNIISGDKDFRAIVGDNINVLDTMHDVIYNRQTVFDKMGVYPENVRDYLALIGDSSDNVPGIDKVGPGTAAKLLTTYGSIQGIIDNQDKLKGKVGENIKTAIADGSLEKYVKLVTMVTDCQVKLKVKDITKNPVDQVAWEEFCTELGMLSFIKNKSPKPN
jgi:DNA polymerase-1